MVVGHRLPLKLVVPLGRNSRFATSALNNTGIAHSILAEWLGPPKVLLSQLRRKRRNVEESGKEHMRYPYAWQDFFNSLTDACALLRCLIRIAFRSRTRIASIQDYPHAPAKWIQQLVQAGVCGRHLAGIRSCSLGTIAE